MDTYTELLPLKDDLNYQQQKKKRLGALALSTVDPSIAGLIGELNELSCCFTLQSCHGHFIQNGEERVSSADLKEKYAVTYRIAYIAFCLEYSISGQEFYKACEEIAADNPENIQFCCAKWFCERQPNSYVLQVEPDRFKEQDFCTLGYREAVTVENIRNTFFLKIAATLKRFQKWNP